MTDAIPLPDRQQLDDAPDTLRCAAQMLAMGADPVGTAGTYAGYLLVEWPRPWPADLGDIEALAPVRAALGRTGIRLQGLVPASDDQRRVILYRRGPGPFAGYRRTERTLDLAPAAQGDPAGIGLDLGTAAAELFAGDAPPVDRSHRDLLVCTHGRRDRCCGSWGTALWQELTVAELGDGTALWRTSHTGGHRYAATMIVLPEGTAWGFVDRSVALRVLHRDGPVTEVLHAYRGCAGLDTAALQAVERVVLGAVGWSVLDTPRTGEHLDGGRVAITLDPEGDPQRWEATVTPGRVLAVPECGSLPTPGGKTTTEQAVGEVVRVA